MPAAADGRFQARVVTPGRMPRHGSTDREIVAAKGNFGRSQNGALDEGVKSTQHYGKQLDKMFRYSSM